VTTEALVKEIGRAGVEYAKSVASGVEVLAREARPGDVILTLGAGSVSQAGAMVLGALAANG
jgi:UDP-N-acetylmuramate--alanine ligase